MQAFDYGKTAAQAAQHAERCMVAALRDPKRAADYARRAEVYNRLAALYRQYARRVN